MTTLEVLQEQIDLLKQRNARVEADKAWETSWARKIAIAFLTYAIIASFFFVGDFARPFVSAIVPTLGFLLSTLSLSVVRHVWIRYWGSAK